MDYEMISWVATAIAALATFGVLWLMAKKDAERYVDLEGWK